MMTVFGIFLTGALVGAISEGLALLCVMSVWFHKG